MPLEKTPWDGIDRRITDAQFNVTSLKIATRAAEGNPLDGDQMFAKHEISAQNHVRPGDFQNQKLHSRVKDILHAAGKDDKAEAPAQTGTAPAESTPDLKEKRELSPEKAEETLKSLLTRSRQEEYKNLCPTIDWTRAEKALRETPEALWTVHQAKEHEPVIYFADETGFKIGSNLCIESPRSTRDCVGHKQAAEWMKENYSKIRFNGDAETQAEDMGWVLMTHEEGDHFAKRTPPYYEQAWRYYRTPDGIKAIGYPGGPGRALGGHRNGNGLGVGQRNAVNPYGYRGWCGSLRVNYVD